MEWFRGKKVLITGGSSGIGKAAAHHLAGWGADVLLVARGRDQLSTFGDPKYGGLDQAVAELRAVAKGGRIEALSLDVTDREAVKAAVPKALELLGGLDVLISCAGIVRPGNFMDLTDEHFESQMRVNYFGPVSLTRAFLPHFLGQRSGSIAYVSSLAGRMGIFGYSAYSPTKFALAGFAEVLRQEVMAQGIKITVVFPPDTDTPQHTEELPYLPAETKAVAATAKLMSPVDVSRELLEGIANGSFHVVPGAQNRVIMGLFGVAPWLVRGILDSSVKKAQKGA